MTRTRALVARQSRGNVHAALYPHDHEHGRMRAPRADSPRIEDAGNAPREMKYGKWNPGRRPIDPVGLIGSPVTAPKKKLKDQGGKALNSKQVTEQPSAKVPVSKTKARNRRIKRRRLRRRCRSAK